MCFFLTETAQQEKQDAIYRTGTRNARLFCHVTGDIWGAKIKWPNQTICCKKNIYQIINFNSLSSFSTRPYCWSNFFYFFLFYKWVVVYRPHRLQIKEQIDNFFHFVNKKKRR